MAKMSLIPSASTFIATGLIVVAVVFLINNVGFLKNLVAPRATAV